MATSDGIATAVVRAEELGVHLDIHLEAIQRDLNDSNMSELDRIDAVNEHLASLYMGRLKVRAIIGALCDISALP